MYACNRMCACMHVCVCVCVCVCRQTCTRSIHITVHACRGCGVGGLQGGMHICALRFLYYYISCTCAIVNITKYCLLFVTNWV